jgi:alkanesulfonate monooxygenase SsuD/methylene tetrahydromethanopterin reductase-like flavin-dependent oxidoreductase (luciferase family)/predicted kinase
VPDTVRLEVGGRSRRGTWQTDSVTSGDAPLPHPAVIVLIGASGAGKSTWAKARYGHAEVVSSDALRAVLGSGEHDLEATDDAFAMLDTVLAARARRGLTTVVDTLGLDRRRRTSYRAVAHAHRLPAVAVVFDTDPAACRRRNRAQDRPVPAPALAAQLRRIADVPAEIATEDWDVVVRVSDGAAPPRTEPARRPAPESPRPTLGFVLQISRFPWGADPAGWLASIVLAAHEAGFTGVALMDHLIQIPQVGRAWEPLPEPWVTLGLLAGLPTRLRLGTLVSPVSAHAAGRLAKTVATLDALTGGRAFCGLGAGWWAREHAAYGLPFPPSAQRLDHLEATIETMRALWAPGTRAYHGRRVNLPETTCYPRPVGGVPIIVGGSAPRLLRVAAELADACNVASDAASVTRARAAMAGKEVTVLDVPVIGSDCDHVASLVERLRGQTPAATYARRHHAGVVSDHTARYRELAEGGVRTVFLALPQLTGPDDVTRLAPMVAILR